MENEEQKMERLRARALAASAWPLNAPPPPPQPFDPRPNDEIGAEDGCVSSIPNHVRRQWEAWDSMCEGIRLRMEKLNAG